MQVNAIGASQSRGANTAPPAPSSQAVQTFNAGMQDNPKSDTCQNQPSDQASQDLGQLADSIMQLVQQLLALLQGQDNSSTPNQTAGGSSTGNGEIKPVSGSGAGGSAGSSELIPPPTEHLQTLSLGGKPVTVGGDGSSSAAEVAATASNIQNLYDNSPSFRNMIDSSTDPSFSVTVGKRSDNTSWGNTEGRVFMNINNIAPTNSDNFQSLLGHEFAHASIDLGHGSNMEQTQDAVAREA